MAVPTPSTEEQAVVQARNVPEGARSVGPGPDDEFLVALAKNGRTDAYDQLVRRYRRFLEWDCPGCTVLQVPQVMSHPHFAARRVEPVSTARAMR